MLGGFLLLHLILEFTQSYAILRIISSDVDRATHVYYSDKISVWEPTSPPGDFYVLGQYINFSDERPGPNVQLIVGSSDDGSLKNPLSFYGEWKIANQFYVWTMRCPQNYVSLGAIATKTKEPPNWSQYGCIQQEETVKADLGNQIFPAQRSSTSIRKIDSPSGHWKNIFFVVEYSSSYGLNTTAYTLKDDPFTHSSQNKVTSGLDLPDLEASEKGNENDSIDSYITLIASAGFVLLVVIILTTLFCVRSRKIRSRNKAISTSTSTGLSYVDSGAPSGGYISENESSFASGNGNTGRSRNRIYSGSSVPFLPHRNTNSLPGAVDRRGGEWVVREVRENIIYHSVTRSSFEENDYEVIN